MKAITDRCDLLEVCLQDFAKKLEEDGTAKAFGTMAWHVVQELRAISELLPDQVQMTAGAQIHDKLRQPPERIIDLPGK